MGMLQTRSLVPLPSPLNTTTGTLKNSTHRSCLSDTHDIASLREFCTRISSQLTALAMPSLRKTCSWSALHLQLLELCRSPDRIGISCLHLLSFEREHSPFQGRDRQDGRFADVHLVYVFIERLLDTFYASRIWVVHLVCQDEGRYAVHPLVADQVIKHRPGLFEPRGRRGRVDDEAHGVRFAVVARPERPEIPLAPEIPELQDG